MVKIGMRKAAMVERMEERTRGRRAAARNEEKGKRMVAKENPEHVCCAARLDTLQLGVEKDEKLYAVDEDDGENAKESTEHEEDLQACCLLEESEHEQWQEVISKHNKRNVKKANPASVRVENNHNSNPKKIVEVTDKCVKVRVAMDSGAAGHVKPEAMFPHVKLERKTTPRKLVAANGEQSKHLGEKKIPFKTSEGIQMCITFRSANNVTHLIPMQKVVRAGNTVVLDERDGTVIKLDVSNAVCTMDMWICLDDRGPVFRDSEWSSRFREQDPETSRLEGRSIKRHTCRSETGACTASSFCKAKE